MSPCHHVYSVIGKCIKCGATELPSDKRSYRPEAVKRILAASYAPPDPNAPTDPDEFLEWLNTTSGEVKS